MSGHSPTNAGPDNQDLWLSLSLLETSGFMLALLDEKNALMQTNRGLQAFLEATQEQLRGVKLEKFVAASCSPSLKKTLIAARSLLQPQELEAEWVSRGGERRWAIWVCEPFPEHSGWILATGRNVTRQRQTRQADLDNQLVTQQAFEKLSALIVIQDIKEGRTVFVNQNPAALLGYSPAQVKSIGADPMCALLNPEDQERISAHQRNMSIARDGEKMEVVFRMRHADGDWRWFLSRDTVFARDADGSVRQVLGIAQDITRQRQNEDLRLRLNEIVESTPDVVVTISSSGSLVYLNWSGRELFGVRLGSLESISLEDLGPKWAIDLIYKEGIPDAVREGYWNGEAALFSSEGVEIPVSLVIVAHPSVTQAEVDYLSLVARDISESRSMQNQLRQARDLLEARVAERTKELRRSEMLYRSLAEAAPDIVYVVSENGRIDYANQRAAHLLGSQPEQLYGRKFNDLLSKETSRQYLAGISRVIKTGQPLAFEALNRYHEGLHWHDTILVPVHDETGKVRQVLGVSRDVTRRKQIEEDLYRSRQMLQSILDHIPQRVFWKDTDLRYLGANRPFLEDAGLQHIDELVGQEDFALAWRPDAERYRSDDRAVIASGADKIGYEEPQRTRDGELRWLRTSKIPLRERDGRIFGVLGSYEDITDARRAEVNLAALNEELSRSNADLEQFAYVASHDLQEPLRMVVSYVQLLEKRYAENLDERGKKYIDYIVEGALRMQQLINDLLVYSRVGTRSKPYKQIQCNQLVGQVLFTLQLAVKEADGRVEVGELPTLIADESQLFQVFQNLVTNAIKFRSKEPPLVKIDAQRAPNCWQFSVSDNGIGIDPQHFERIFTIFQRLHAREEYPGTGIGLAICKRIIQRHGGKIWVESTPGQGSTFYFTIEDSLMGETYGE